MRRFRIWKCPSCGKRQTRKFNPDYDGQGHPIGETPLCQGSLPPKHKAEEMEPIDVVPLSEVKEALLDDEAVEALAKKRMAHRGDWLLVPNGERNRALDKARLHLREVVDAAFASTESEGQG